ncbi:MAG: cytochrome c oxidase subunit 3 family protein [Betaproteobacteria bacterium]|nr:cytochrome c oxidase subunit 3 family protein [Betaproteobacteria bacterium]
MTEIATLPPPRGISIFSEAQGRIPGNKGIWVGIYCEMTEFALMFTVYFLAKSHFPAVFQEGPTRLATSAGTANTVFMLTSSFFVVRALHAVRGDRIKSAIRWLFLALMMGLSYLVVKFLEYRWYTSQGIRISSSAFFTVYYYLTLNHLVHVFWGSLGILFVLVRTKMGAYSSQGYEGLEAFASYWHAIDLAWLGIFPLLYVLR